MKKCKKMGLQIDGEFLSTLLFADQIIIAEDQDDICYMLRKLIEEYSGWGLEINMSKTQHIAYGDPKVDIVLPFGVIKSVEEYKYLGITINRNGSDEQDIRNKIAAGKKITQMLHPIIWNSKITKKSAITYGSELWVLNNRERQRLQAAEMEKMLQSN